MRNFNSESFPPYDNSIESTLDLNVPLSKWPNESPLQPTWKTRIKEKLAKVKQSYRDLQISRKNLSQVEELNGFSEVREALASQPLGDPIRKTDDLSPTGNRAQKIKSFPVQSKEKTNAEAALLVRALIHDRRNAEGAETTFKEGVYETTFPGRKSLDDEASKQWDGDTEDIRELFSHEEDIAPKAKLTPAQAREKILSEAFFLGKVLLHDRGSVVGAKTIHENGFYKTTYPSKADPVSSDKEDAMPTTWDDLDFFAADEEIDSKNNRTGILENLSIVEKAKNARGRLKKLIPSIAGGFSKLLHVSKRITSSTLAPRVQDNHFSNNKEESGFENARILELEDLELKEKAKNAREKIKKMIPNMIEKYDKLPLAGKLAISGALVGAGIVATVSGSGALAVGVWGGKLALRGLGSYLAGRTAEKLMRAHAMKNLSVGQELSKEKERKLKMMNVATAVSVFLAGTWAEYALHGAPAFMNSGVESHTSTVSLPAHAPTPVVTDAITPIPSVDVAAPTHVPSASPAVDQLVRHTNFVGIHEVVVRPGDTLTKILLHGGIYEMFQPEEIAKLSWQGKQNLLANIVTNLNAEQLKEVGVTSGKANLLKLGDTIDVMKLAKVAKDITVTVAGDKVPLLKRALELS